MSADRAVMLTYSTRSHSLLAFLSLSESPPRLREKHFTYSARREEAGSAGGQIRAETWLYVPFRLKCRAGIWNERRPTSYANTRWYIFMRKTQDGAANNNEVDSGKCIVPASVAQAALPEDVMSWIHFPRCFSAVPVQRCSEQMRGVNIARIKRLVCGRRSPVVMLCRKPTSHTDTHPTFQLWSLQRAF